LDPDVASAATVTAIRRAIGEMRFAEEGDAAAASAAGVDGDGAFVDEDVAAVVVRGGVQAR
jgi:hypothetical protein